MHELEPFYNWREHYRSEEDDLSPFYGKEYDEFNYSTKIYNYFIHPQWDFFGSPTLYLKVLYSDYDQGFCIMELIGEWNDAIHNDVMFLKREIADVMIHSGINKFILIGENILNFHGSDDCYYEEWAEDVQDEEGWIVLVNFREHVIDEMRNHGLHYHLFCGEQYDIGEWRKHKPDTVFQLIDARLMKSLL
jgi:hypothetical protein